MCIGCVTAVREVYPTATDDEVEFLLWEKSPYPHGGPEHVLKSMQILKATQDAGLTECDWCNHPAQDGQRTCESCAEAFK